MFLLEGLGWINKYRLNLGDRAMNFQPFSALPAPFCIEQDGAYRSNFTGC